MDWVKLGTRYFRDHAIARRTDQHEVMFTRGMALCGETESSGFIPNELVADLCRKKRDAFKIAASLVEGNLWEQVEGGYQITNWDSWQAELERLVAKKKRDRDRKRRERASGVRGQSVDASEDSPVENRAIESKSKSKTAAAAAVDAAAAADDQDLSPSLAILADKLRAHTPLRGLRFDALGATGREHLEHLIAQHGDHALVDVAIRTLRTPAPVTVNAFLGTWASLPAPGQRLAVVKAFCDQPGHEHQELRSDGSCGQCVIAAKVGDR